VAADEVDGSDRQPVPPPERMAASSRPETNSSLPPVGRVTGRFDAAETGRVEDSPHEYIQLN